MKEELDFIYKQQQELSSFGGISSLLGWDQMTYMPPLGGIERSEQLSLISRLSHELVISDKLYTTVQKLHKDAVLQTLSDYDKIIIQRLSQDIEKARKIPSTFVEEMAKTTTLAYQAWEQAREKNSFSIFQPHLEKIVALEKQYAGFIALPGPAYNSLLDEYEEGMTVDSLKHEFNYLKPRLTSLLEKITASDIFHKQQPFQQKIPLQQQQELCQQLLQALLLPQERTRIDVSTHPFTTSMGNDDVRITTNYERGNTLFSFFSTIHEAGHALYELGLPKDKYRNTVISDAPSLGLHESQSRFWENMIGKSKPFWSYFYPFFQKKVPHLFKDIKSEQWYQIINQVRPSLIRVEADELTYCLHVILRFELECDLIDGELSVADLPYQWNEKMDDMLGISPSSDKDGVLQDMHWSGGSFGYFPTYAIGTIYAAQLFEKMIEQHQHFIQEIEAGTFINILQWLQTHVHHYGRRFTAEDIIKTTCGEGLNASIFINYLQEKYSTLYEI